MPKKKEMIARNHVFIENEDNNDNLEESDYDNLIPTSYEEEFSNKSAAKESRLKHNRLSSLEQKYFNKEDRNTYLKLRNAILRIWHNKPSVIITLDVIKTKIKINEKRKIELAEKILQFLERYGYVNFGVFENTLPEKCVNPKNRKRTIIVIGAGTSGLIAARQLIYFGFNVIVLEASRRVGGRCYSFYKNDIFFDPGNIFVSGIRGNPIRTVMKQLGLNAKRLKAKHKLYMDGVLVDKKKDLVIHKIFLIFLRTLYFITLEKGITEINGNQLSPENIFDAFIYFLEVATTSRTIEHCRKLLHLEENLSYNLNPLINEFESFLKNASFFRSFYFQKNNPRVHINTDDDNNEDDFDTTVVFDENIFNNQTEYSFGSILKSHMAFIKCIQFDKTNKLIMTKKNIVLTSDKFSRCVEFFSLEDRRIFEWYFGTLELFLGAPLSKYSLKKFANDDFDYSDKQYLIPDGYMNFMQAMYSQRCSMKIWKRMRAQKIRINPNSVEVLAIKENDLETTCFQGDAVICTLPLGVLKMAIKEEKDIKFKNNISFEPSLPEHKKTVIERFGVGTVNKCIIGFENNFWATKDQFFGNIPLTRECRGEFLISYFNTPSSLKNNNLQKVSKTYLEKKNKNKKNNKPKQMYSITSVMCGHCVDMIKRMGELLNECNEKEENSEDVIIVSTCYKGLKEIFENIPNYTASLVTHWDNEPFYMGTHSYPTTESSPDDYDVLAEPVAYSSQHSHRLFFAGEHTNKDYPSTVHGAFLSGLRAASEVANLFDPLNFN